MIYVSTSCVKSKRIGESVRTLADIGFKNIELSGGTKQYPEFIDELTELKNTYKLSYLCHNYFPPPDEDFVLNLGSQEDKTFNQAIDLCTKSIKMSEQFGGTKYAIHAGFFSDINHKEFGHKIGLNKLSERDLCYRKYAEGFDHLRQISSQVELYIENNALSIANKETYGGDGLFMFTHYESYLELLNYIKFTPLLDVAHLKVSCNSHGIDFSKELKKFFKLTDYVHVSDNDAQYDYGWALKKDGELTKLLSELDWSGKTVTLEVYDGLEELQNSYNIMKEVMEY